MKSKVFIALILILILIQFLPIDKTNPTINPSLDLIQTGDLSASEVSLLKAACMDCHSHETIFPAYTRFQPVGWFLRSHIRGGRQKVNFSEWGNYSTDKKNHKLEECKEVIEEKRMPMKSYTWLHPKAKLSAEQKTQLISLFDRLKS